MKKEIEESEKVRFEHGEAPGQTSFPNLHSPAAASARQKTPSSNALMGANLAKSGANTQKLWVFKRICTKS